MNGKNAVMEEWSVGALGTRASTSDMESQDER